MRPFAVALFIFVALAPMACLPADRALAATQTTGTNTAQTQTTGVNTAGKNVPLLNPLGESSCSDSGTCLESFLNSILRFVIRIGTIAIILMLIYIGYLFVVAQGAPGKIEEARRALLWTIVGALILLGAQAIALGIEATVKAIATGN